MPNPLLHQDCLDIHTFLTQPGASFSTTGLYQYEDIESQGDLRCDWRIRKSAVGLNVQAAMAGILLLSDTESARVVEYPVTLSFEEQFFLNPPGSSRNSHRPEIRTDAMAATPTAGEQQVDDLMEAVDEDGTLDLRDLARQYLVMEISGLPMLPSGQTGQSE